MDFTLSTLTMSDLSLRAVCATSYPQDKQSHGLRGDCFVGKNALLAMTSGKCRCERFVRHRTRRVSNLMACEEIASAEEHRPRNDMWGGCHCERFVRSNLMACEGIASLAKGRSLAMTPMCSSLRQPSADASQVIQQRLILRASQPLHLRQPG